MRYVVFAAKFGFRTFLFNKCGRGIYGEKFYAAAFLSVAMLLTACARQNTNQNMSIILKVQS